MRSRLIETEILAGYRLVAELGRGGMGSVYQAIDESSTRTVAIKLLHTTSSDAESLARFEREANALKQLTHPNIVRLIDYLVVQETPYLVMEYVEGVTLKNFLDPFAAENNGRDLKQILDISSQVATALAYAHEKNILHRDVKPANIILEKETNRAVLMDFGLAKFTQQDLPALTMTQGFLGTPSYIAPERTLGNPGDNRADIYSLGVILFQLVTGRLPYEAETLLGLLLKLTHESVPYPSDFNPDMPAALEAIIMKAMAKDPAARYHAIQTMLNELWFSRSSEKEQKSMAKLANNAA